MGKVGCDDNAARIRGHLTGHGIDDSLLISTPDHPTSTTQVLYVRDSSGRVNRTFRHYFGAMGDFSPATSSSTPLPISASRMIGYCLLLPLSTAKIRITARPSDRRWSGFVPWESAPASTS